MAETRRFLLEIGCEEMPSAPLMNAQSQLGKLMEKGLSEAELDHGDITTLSTPRRLAVMVEDCATTTEEIHEVLRGPAATVAFDESGSPTKAAEGFARKCGVDVGLLVRREAEDGREYVYAEHNIASKDAFELLSELSEHIIGSLEWPNYRSQRWGSEHASFVRPIRWICALLGDKQVHVCYADVTSGSTTRGHRVLSAGEHLVECADAYERVLEHAHVLGEQRRAEVIREGIATIEAERGGAHVDTPKATFDEVVNLCEWPTLVVGTFDEEFLSVPHEIIVEAMLKHQRYFPIYASDGSLTREFVIVSNANPSVNDTVRSGNERVVRPRLDDAKFFFEEDLKVGLDEFRERLSDVVFHKSLGSVLLKSQRMELIAGAIAGQASNDADLIADAQRAAHLAKADLVSQAVIEFTSQQGVMGGYYAKAQGEHERVANAIAQHYRPRFAGDATPDDIVGKSVAMADKMDTICGMFAVGEPPTGSADPFAVRRSAIGVIAMLREMDHVSISAVISKALDALQSQGLSFDRASVESDVRAFFAGRLQAIAREEGISPDTIQALCGAGVIDPVEYLMRAHALEDARTQQRELFDDLATAYARASHLVEGEVEGEIDHSLLEDSERALLDACERGERAVSDALAAGDYAGSIAALAGLKEPIDRFFEEVLVMDEDTDKRSNRLRLLNRFCSVFQGVADIGALARKA